MPPSSSPSSQCPKLQNLRVSLPKLSLPPELSPQPTKKIKLEEKDGESSQNNANSFLDNKPLLDSKCNVKVLPKSLKILYNKVKNESPKERDALLAQLKEEFNSSSEDIKLELAKLESVLEGKLLLNIASHKLSDMLLQDKTLNSNFSVKQELENFDEKPTAENLEIPAKLGKDVICSNNNNIIENKGAQQQESSSQVRSVDDKFKEFVKCKWQGCDKEVEVQHLLEHLLNIHITTQKTDETESKYQCLWTGCKVFSTCSTSYTWLTRHVTKHVGSKPFLCIVDGCRQRFGNQVTLSRHVNSHFKNPTGTGTAGSPSGPSQKRQSAPSSPLKFYIRKNRRKTLRSSRDQAEASVPASGPDLFHIGIMAGIKDGLSRFSSASNRSSSLSPSSLDLVFTNGGELVFRPGSVKSRKLDEDGNIQYLVSWHPGGMFEDEWLRADMKFSRKVAINKLPGSLKNAVEKKIFGGMNQDKRLRKTLKSSGPSKLT